MTAIAIRIRVAKIGEIPFRLRLKFFIFSFAPPPWSFSSGSLFQEFPYKECELRLHIAEVTSLKHLYRAMALSLRGFKMRVKLQEETIRVASLALLLRFCSPRVTKLFVYSWNGNISIAEISILYRVCCNKIWLTMQEKNEPNVYLSVTFEKLIDEWNICENKFTRIKPIQLARGLSV
jgi:hypothetical protein